MHQSGDHVELPLAAVTLVVPRVLTENPPRCATRWFLKTCLLLGACTVVASWLIPTSRAPLHDSVLASIASTGMREVHSRVKPIEQIQLGERVAGRNLLRDQVDEVEPNPSTWRHVKLHMVKENGLSLWVELLRPQHWFNALDVHVGGTVDLDLPEMGAQGPAEVLPIGPCPEILDGDGPVVTGKFTHETDGKNVVSLRLEGESEPTGVTTNHPYWSEDRKDFIAAGDLRPGETVNTLTGPRRVASITPLAYTGLLNNLETTEHVYRVASFGTMVHNSYGLNVSDVHPRLPIRNGRGPTHGIFNDSIPIVSGSTGGRGLNVFGPRIATLSDDAVKAITHAEGHAAAEMVRRGLKEGVLHINYKTGPCQYCINGIQELLEKEMRLWVVFPDGVGFFTSSGWTRLF
ncbi:MAG: hypothetical protein HY290_11040 [Planctomycetia bacterium]|nr:hypothetical protein [Planctomycetia bacterium]